MILALAFLTLFFGAADKDTIPIKEFKQHAASYVELQKKVKAGLTPETKNADAEVLEKQRNQFVKAMQIARPNAAQGDIFSRPARRALLKIIKKQLAGAEGAKARAMILGEGNPKMTLKVNDAYPASVPRSSVPPSLLKSLPELPPQLEYRFVGHHLILHDAEADIIVDFILNAIP